MHNLPHTFRRRIRTLVVVTLGHFNHSFAGGNQRSAENQKEQSCIGGGKQVERAERKISSGEIKGTQQRKSRTNAPRSAVCSLFSHTDKTHRAAQTDPSPQKAA